MDRWEAYYIREPWGHPAEDSRAGQMASAICLAMGLQISPALIATGTKPPEAEQTAAEQRAIVQHQADIQRTQQGWG